MGSSTSFQAQVAHFRLCPLGDQSADTRRGMAANFAKLPNVLKQR
jgi:hypothetical protein